MLALKCLFSVFILLSPTLWAAGRTINKSLTVLMDFEAPHSEASLESLRSRLNQILSATGLQVDVQIQSDLPDHAEFGQLVIFKMRGSCSLATHAAGPLYDERGPLAMAYVSDGAVLHFGEVECDRVRLSLQRILGRNVSLKNQQAYGSALAVVIAHEVYHMLGNERNHTHKGLTKPELSASELLESKPLLPEAAVTSIDR